MHPKFIPSQIGDLVLETLPNGELAWLRRELDTAIDDAELLGADLTDTLGWPTPQPDEDGPRYTITPAGRDYLARDRAMQALFGRPWPTVAEAHAAEASAA